MNETDFAHHVDASLRDGFLSEMEWNVLLNWAANLGFSKAEAETLIIKECVKRSAVIEHVETRRLRDLVSIASSSKILDTASEALLRRLIEERDWQVETRNLLDLNRLLDRLLEETWVWQEERFKEGIRRRLSKAAGDTKSIPPEEWRRIYRASLEARARPPASEADDLADLFYACRRELEIGIAVPKPKVVAPPDEPVAPTTGISAPRTEALGPTVEIKPVPVPQPIPNLKPKPAPINPRPQPPGGKSPGEDRPGFFDTLPGVIVIALVVAGVVFGILMLSRGTSEDPTTQPLAPASGLPQDAAEYMAQAQNASTREEACEVLARCVESIERVSDDAATPCRAKMQELQCPETTMRPEGRP